MSDLKKEIKRRRGDTWLEEGLRDKYSDKQYKPNIENTKKGIMEQTNDGECDQCAEEDERGD